ncbi:DUF4153 domain-containing protein [Clostridium sp. Cult1]|nr:DUF4153 domain-containing protein [Clostridium sp. Cult1]
MKQKQERGEIMNFTLRIKNVFRSIKNSFRRFPITIGVSTALVIMLVILSEKGSQLTQNSREILQRINMIIALGIPLSLCVKLIYEKKKYSNRVYEVIGYIFGGVILILYYLFLLKDFSMTSMVRYIGVSLFLYLAFAYIPWIGRKADYESYIIKVFSSFFLTAIYSFVLYLGISAILFTIDQLFNANIPGKYFYYTFLIIAGIFAPSLFLARIPEIDEDFSEYEYPKSLKVLLLYIVIPLIAIYSTILYAYFLKIIITRIWPQGLVSHLVLWYSVLSVAVIFFITPILDMDRWAYRFKFWLSKLILPILIMMFISIGIRVKTYGITENRYFILVLGLWVLGIMLYFAFSRKLNNIIIPISLSIIALNSVFGPLSSFSISKLSQNNRLKSILTRNHMLEGSKILKAPEDISIEDKEEISAILRYFENHHSLENIKKLPEDFEIKDMNRVFGFPYTEKDLYGYDYFYYQSEEKGKVLEVKEYHYLLESYGIVDSTQIKDNVMVSYNDRNYNFKIEEKDNIIYETNLKKYALDIIKNIEDLNIKGNNTIEADKMIFIDENEKIKVKFVINSINGERRSSIDDTMLRNIDYYVLIKIK